MRTEPAALRACAVSGFRRVVAVATGGRERGLWGRSERRPGGADGRTDGGGFVPAVGKSSSPGSCGKH